MNEERHSEPTKHKGSRVEVYWTTVTYRTVAIYAVVIFALVMGTLYLIYPDWYSGLARRVSDKLGQRSTGLAAPTVSQARFINLDGKVEVKKVDSVRWVSADYRTFLDKGDLVQTTADGVARISFTDGTTYVVKPDTLITVEENSMGQDRSTRVGVAITSGAVDLTTGTWEAAGSRAEVSFENARASLNANSRAAVRSDPTKKQHEITVATGSAELQRGGERITIGQWEKVSFPTGGQSKKARVLAPPELAQPVNLQPIIVPEPRRAAVRFEWQPVQGAAAYHLRVSTSSMFAHVVAERRTSGPGASVTGLDPGDYFWGVTAIDAQNRVSEPSETHKFTLAAQGKGQEMLLDIEGTQLHGNVVEVIGRTEPGAAIIINGQAVANLQNDGRFRHFTERLARGSQTIVITGQNRRGGTAIKRVQIVVP